MSEPDIPFLAGLDAEARAAVRARMDRVTVAGGCPLFEQGEPGDALYTLVSGSVGISMRDEGTGAVRRVARLMPPDAVGEMALLSAAPRSATATALRDSHLLRLTRQAFEAVIERHPGTLLYFSRLLAERLRSVYETGPVGRSPRTFAVLAVTDGPPATAFGQRLAEAFDAILPGRTGCLSAWPEGVDEAWFHGYEAGHDRTIYIAHRVDGPWCRLCLRQADHILLLAEPGARLRRGGDYLAGLRSEWVRTDLAIRQEPGIDLPRALHPEVAALPASLRIQVRAGRTEDFCRLARLASGLARGAVFGGGGARGLAHLGVLRALDEAGMPIDFVGGTSMGAIIAASLAMGWSGERIHRHTVETFVGRNPLSDYTLPLHALTRGVKVDAGLALRFGETRIEDLWLPFFCVSSNLTTGAATIHRDGPVRTALRASVAVPGLLPPVCTQEGVLVDGGMMNNLPADIAAGLERGPVLAVDVGGDFAFRGEPVPGRAGRLLRRWLGASETMPGIVPLLLRAATVSSDAKAMRAAGSARAVVKPPLDGIDLRDWSAYEAIAGIGYRCAAEAIAAGTLADWSAPPPR